MKKLFFLCLVILFSNNLPAQTTFWTHTFESSGGYSTSILEFTDGGGDYFLRTDGSDIGSWIEFSNVQDIFYFAAMDIDGEGATLPVTLTFDDLDISGQSSITFYVYLAEDDDGTNEDWDAADYFHIDYDIDNSGTFSNLLWVESSGATNTPPRIDTDFDGTGDGTEIDTTFTEFSVSIPGTGSTIDFEITFNLNSGDEDIALDNLRMTSTAAGTPLITVIPSTLSGFSYVEGSGPSSEQSFDISGADLTDDITITPPTNYEISTGTGGSFVPTDPITLTQSGGTVNSTPIYVRLKAGLSGGTYDGEDITATSIGAATQNVTCNGAVVKAEPTNHVTNFNGIQGDPSYYYIIIDWTDATGGTEPDGYLIKGSEFHYDSIAVPVDGVPESNSLFVQNVAQGIQTETFGLNSGSTYYFKIFPYTNSDTEIDYKTDGSVPELSIATTNAPSLPVIENFEYTVGSILTDNGWIAHSGVGNYPIQVTDTTLTYTGYVNSGLGKSVTIDTYGEDVNRAFNNVSTESIYASFMVSITSAETGGNYFFHLGQENSYYYYGRVFVKNDGADNIAFGIRKTYSGDVAYTPFSYALDTTYLVVVKYTFIDTTTTDDVANLWVNPVLDGIEPLPDVTQGIGDDVESLGMFALRQGSSSSSPGLILGGIRVADTWVTDSVATTFPLAVSVVDGWNMVSVPGLHPVDQNITTWWSNLTGQVFKFDNGYVSVPTVVTGEGYWLNNSGAETYNYAAIDIVTHASIPVVAGWNMIGGYENTAPVSGLIPSAGTILSVFGYSNGYVTATNLVPGYGYWINVTDAGTITIPDPPLSKGSGEVVEYIKDDWGKIIITDNAGRSYTLYAVNGEVDLNKYELPPMPPVGMFDIRYGSGRIAEDINSSIQSIEMTGLEYPITVQVENMDIRLQDETGNQINENMKSGDEITISNTSINKLMVLSGEMIPDVYALEQNYPNPFNPSTVIEFSLPEDVNNVQLTIYDVLGQRITQLVNTSLKAGQYSYQWNAGIVATGMYIYELRTDKFVSVKKMILMK